MFRVRVRLSGSLRSARPAQLAAPSRAAHSSIAAPPTRSWRRRLLVSVLGGSALSLGYALSPLGLPSSRPLASSPRDELARAYFIWAAVGVPYLVDVAPGLLQWARASSLPGVAPATDWIVRRTFFSHFVGGETVETTLPLLHSLAQRHIGVILNHSCEVDPHHSGTDTRATVHTSLIASLLHSIDVASSSSAEAGSVSIAIKLSGLLSSPAVLERVSAAIVPREHFSLPPAPAPPAGVGGGSLSVPLAALDAGDAGALRELWEALRGVARHAREKNVRLLIDAEYSWYQPAIDALYEALASEFNSLAEQQGSQPLLFNTYQTYLRRTPSHLAASLERARRGGYALGVKLVRGAYVDIENAAWRTHVVQPPPAGHSRDERAVTREERGSPVWASKALTDACYDACAVRLIEELAKEPADEAPRLAVVFASHNVASARAVVAQMQTCGLAASAGTKPSSDPSSHEHAGEGQEAEPPVAVLPHVRGRLAFAQLFGMADELTRLLLHTFAAPSPAAPGDDSFSPRSSVSAAPVAPLVYKYVPWGALDDVLPYLLRRAQENSSLSAGARRERQLIWSEARWRMREALHIV